MDAIVQHVSYIDGAETIECNGHLIQYGYGSGGDGFCYSHQSFNCIEKLTKEECEATKHARYLGVFDIKVSFNI